MTEVLTDEDWHSLVVALVRHFIRSEGTDYLGDKGRDTGVPGLLPDQEARLRELRDEARRIEGWHGY